MISKNGQHFLYKGGLYSLYDPPLIDAVAVVEINGTEMKTIASGGFRIQVRGQRFFNSPFLRCRWGAACNSNADDCAKNTFGVEVILESDKLTDDQLYGPPATWFDTTLIECTAPARPMGEWQIFVGNNGQNYDNGGNKRTTFKPCSKGTEAQFYYQECLPCKPGKFDVDEARYEREILPGRMSTLFCVRLVI